MYSVLIVEDDPMVAMINEQYITRNSQFTVTGKCTSGKEAIAFLEKNKADLIIMDVYMPQMDCIETLQMIRQKNYPVSVIMVTAANDLETFEISMRLGAIDYLVKPFAYERFSLALEKFALKTSALKEGRTLNQNRIDIIVGGSEQNIEAMPKGIQEKTKTIILDCLAKNGGWMAGEAIAEETGLSSVTVRRYMNHLTESGSVSGRMNYETGGRPSMLYRL